MKNATKEDVVKVIESVNVITGDAEEQAYEVLIDHTDGKVDVSTPEGRLLVDLACSVLWHKK